MIFFPVSILSEDQKKGVHQIWNPFFPPNSSEDQRSDAHQSQIIGGDADVDHTQIIGGNTVKFLGYVSPIPSGLRHPCQGRFKSNTFIWEMDFYEFWVSFLEFPKYKLLHKRPLMS